MKERLRENQGITLIALVITIIVLLILAGVSIAMLTGDNGILTQANNTKIEQSHGAVREGIALAYNEYQIEINTANNTKLASKEIVTIQGEEDKTLANTSLTFLTFLDNKGYIKEGTTDVLNVEALTGSKQTLGNGESTDIYKIEEKDDSYVVNYYGKGTNDTKEIWNVNKIEVSEEDIKSIKMLIETDENGNAVLPIPTTESCTIDWGDGFVTNEDGSISKSEKIASTGKMLLGASTPDPEGYEHKYDKSNSEYVVTISGDVKILTNTSTENGTSRRYLKEILQWGETGLINVSLSDCENLKKIPGATNNSFKNLIYISFRNSGITEIPENLFGNCPNIKDFSYTFAGTAITHIPENLFVNCPNVEDFSYTFERTAITNIPEGLFANCNKVYSFSGTFGNTQITSIPENLFANCPNVEDFSYAFRSTAIINIPENLFANCDKVYSFSETFRETEITSIPENLFKNCPNAEDFSFAFAYTEVTEVPESLFSNCNNVKDFSYTFIATPISKTPELWLRVPDGEKCFEDCVHLENADDIPEYWK